MAEPSVTLSLSRAQALVLLEALSLLEENKWAKLPDEAELRVFWNLEAQLEHLLTEQFQPDYLDLLARAKRDILER